MPQKMSPPDETAGRARVRQRRDWESPDSEEKRAPAAHPAAAGLPPVLTLGKEERSRGDKMAGPDSLQGEETKTKKNKNKKKEEEKKPRLEKNANRLHKSCIFTHPDRTLSNWLKTIYMATSLILSTPQRTKKKKKSTFIPVCATITISGVA